MMATINIATRGTSTLIWPSLILLRLLERKGLLQISKVDLQDKTTLDGSHQIELSLPDETTIKDEAILTHILSITTQNLPVQKAEINKEWFQRAQAFTLSSYPSLKQPLQELNAHLTLRSYIVGYDLNIADLYAWSCIRANSIALANLKKSFPDAWRWYTFIEEANPWLDEVVKELTAQAAQRAKEISTRGASFDLGLPSFTGPTTTRFPPEPSGYLHIGHAKAALLNDYFAHHDGQRGTLICRFDDTNPSKESMEFQDAIVEDLAAMQIYPDKTSYSSDYFQEMYELAVKLIKSGKAFADDSALGRGDTERRDRKPSARRDLGIEETLKYFEEMKAGTEEGQRWCLRARIAYDSPNGTLRDPVIYRGNQIPHHRTGRKWNIYPTYDFCAPILDALEGVTIALRTNEYRDRNVQYAWMQEALGLRKVPIWDFSRMNLVRTFLSKRKLTAIVNEGVVWGWDDPRMPTIRGILRRGMEVSALREFILQQGPSQNILNLQWGALWAMNKKVIDPVAARFTAIDADDVVHCKVTGLEEAYAEDKPKHAKNKGLGTKKVMYSSEILLEQIDAQSFDENEEITLMNWGNAIVRSITKETASKVSNLELELHLAGDVKKTKKKITWLSAEKSNLVPIILYTFDYLLTKDKLEKGEDPKDFLNPHTAVKVDAWADCNVAGLAKNATIQFDRKGYFKLDKAYTSHEERMVFFDVPSGKS